MESGLSVIFKNDGEKSFDPYGNSAMDADDLKKSAARRGGGGRI